MHDHYTVFTDGGARGNPGPAGIGVSIVDHTGKEIKTISEFLGRQTNNFAEYEAVIAGLMALKKIIPKDRRRGAIIDVFSDSELVTKQLNGEYQIKEETLFPQFIRIWNLRVGEFPNVTFTHVRREKNVRADQLANEAMDRGH